MKVGITGANGFIGTHLKNALENPLLFKGDLNDIAQVRDFIRECDRIYHLAGKNRDDCGKILKNNLVSTANIILAMKLENKFPGVVFASSQQAIWNPDSEYGFTKILEEEIIKKAPKWCIFRIPNVYGPGCKPFYNSVVATFCYQLSQGQEVTIHDSTAEREFIYINDLIQELVHPEFNSYKVPEGEVLSIAEIHSLLTDRLGEHSKLKSCFDSYRKAD